MYQKGCYPQGVIERNHCQAVSENKAGDKIVTGLFNITH